MFVKSKKATVLMSATCLTAAVAALAGCSNSNSSSSSSSSASASASASASQSSATASPSGSASQSNIGGDVLPPVMVAPGQTTANAKVGETVVFSVSDPTTTKISTDRPDVLTLTQGRTDGSATFNPGAEAVGPGVAVVTVTQANGTTEKVTVTVTAGVDLTITPSAS